MCWFESSSGHKQKNPARSAGFFYLDAWRARLPKQTNKRDLRAERAGIFCLGKPLVEVSGSLEVIRYPLSVNRYQLSFAS